MRPLLEWGAAGRPLAGQSVSGDRAFVTATPPLALAVAIDGLGHGAEAAEAAEAAVAAVRDTPSADVVDVVSRCHRALEATRGAAIGIASLDADEDTLTWVAVGNVEGRLVGGSDTAPRGPTSLMTTAGIVGHELPARLHPETRPIRRGDLVLLATDGVTADFADDVMPWGPCRTIAGRLIERHARPSDDAVVLVLRYLGIAR